MVCMVIRVMIPFPTAFHLIKFVPSVISLTRVMFVRLILNNSTFPSILFDVSVMCLMHILSVIVHTMFPL